MMPRAASAWLIIRRNARGQTPPQSLIDMSVDRGTPEFRSKQTALMPKSCKWQEPNLTCFEIKLPGSLLSPRSLQLLQEPLAEHSAICFVLPTPSPCPSPRL